MVIVVTQILKHCPYFEAKRNHKASETVSLSIFRWSGENGKTYCGGTLRKSYI
jgi:hypothetical protein